MPTILVIDDDHAVHVYIRAIVSEWMVYSVYDGITGLDLVQHYLHTLDLIILDIDIPRMDGYLTCLQIRAISQTIAILPFTTSIEAIPFLRELACLPPVSKGVDAEVLCRALQSAIHAKVPALSPGLAVFAFAQQQASYRERIERQCYNAQPIVLYVANPVTRLGLYQLLVVSGEYQILEAPTIESATQLVQANSNSIVVADAHHHMLVCDLIQQYHITAILIASTLLDGVVAASDEMIQVVILVTDCMVTTLSVAFKIALSGGHYRSPELEIPFAEISLTAQQRAHLLLEAYHWNAKAIAQRLGVEVTTIYQYRQRLRDKLGLQNVKELSVWASNYLFGIKNHNITEV
ncbi:MAG: hypothetical protein GFH24_608346n31 [Chloroflexi bacterium AL-N5]|nr:hypothetical protein [Chloroflexi bacterium AL-N5]